MEFKDNVEDALAVKLNGDTAFIVTGGLSNMVAKTLHTLYPTDGDDQSDTSVALESMSIDQSERAGMWQALVQSDSMSQFNQIKGILSFDAQTAALSDYLRITNAVDTATDKTKLKVVMIGDNGNVNSWAQALLEQLNEQGVIVVQGKVTQEMITSWIQE
jgi:hypothetical protein